MTLMHMCSRYPLIFMILLTIFMTCLWMTNHFINKTHRDKLLPYECGFSPMNNARTPFSMRFFLLAVVFLIFDIEITLLMMMPLLNMNQMMTTLIPMSIFMWALMWGTLHEIYEGTLNWSE